MHTIENEDIQNLVNLKYINFILRERERESTERLSKGGQ
jgi:hypothetical protein